MPQPVRFHFQCLILHDRHTAGQRVSHPPLTLLDDMGQLVAEQLPSGRRLGLILTRRKVKVGTLRESPRTDTCGLRSDMDTHTAEVGAKRPLHLAAHLVRQRLPRPGLAQQH
jgi:hypothetical protein